MLFPFSFFVRNWADRFFNKRNKRSSYLPNRTAAAAKCLISMEPRQGNDTRPMLNPSKNPLQYISIWKVFLEMLQVRNCTLAFCRLQEWEADSDCIPSLWEAESNFIPIPLFKNVLYRISSSFRIGIQNSFRSIHSPFWDLKFKPKKLKSREDTMARGWAVFLNSCFTIQMENCQDFEDLFFYRDISRCIISVLWAP